MKTGVSSKIAGWKATTTFKDGKLLEVDGNAGTVRVVVEEQVHEPALVG